MLRSGSGTRAPWSQSWRVGLSPGLGGPSVALGPLRVGEWMRERVLGLSAVWPLICASVSSESRPCGRRCLAVWPLVSGRVASGLSPRGVASFVHARLGVRGYQGRMVSNLPSPCPSTCYRCPDGALWWLASAKTKRPTMGFSLIGALPGLNQRRQGGRECAVRFWIQLGWGWGVTARKRCRPPCPMPSVLEEDAAGAVK